MRSFVWKKKLQNSELNQEKTEVDPFYFFFAIVFLQKNQVNFSQSDFLEKVSKSKIDSDLSDKPNLKAHEKWLNYLKIFLDGKC